MKKIYNLHFDGSISDSNKDQLPTYSGIYLVYRGVDNVQNNKYTCKEIIYIGQADDIKERHKNHEKHDEFLKTCKKGEIVFYSYVHVAKLDLDRVENALIFKMQPCLNDKMTQTFPYDETIVVSDGQCALLSKNFTLQRKDS